MKKTFVTVILTLCVMGTYAQNIMNVMFYNTENLFDTSDNPLKDDDEFTPEGARRWTNRRYWSKLTNLSRVIAAVDEDNAPEIIGLCEVENDSVLADLTGRAVLKRLGYDYVVTDSPDRRGINVALLYKKNYFRLVGWETLPVDLTPVGGTPTRDILHVTGRILNGDTLDIYVCHWPSRVGGVEESEPRRRIAAGVVLESVRKVNDSRRKPYVVIMGDLNEGADDSAVRQTLSAHRYSEGENLPDSSLVTAMDALSAGSYKYEGEWDCYDQFVVSASMLNGRGCTEISAVRICRLDFLLEDDKKYGGKKPLRTYNGYRYQNGFSDHLPIALDLSY